MIPRARKPARRKCKRCDRLIATASELSRSYDKPRTDRCYVVWSMRDLGLRPAQMKMVMSPAVKAMARDLAVTRSRERLFECNAAHYLRAVKLLIDAIGLCLKTAFGGRGFGARRGGFGAASPVRPISAGEP